MPDQPLQPQLYMLRPDLTGLRPVECPAGYAVRCYRPGDARHWEAILKEAFGGEYSFDRVLRCDVSFRPERLWFAAHDGTPVAAAGGFYRPSFIKDAGFLHYVAVLPAHRGVGLGSVVCLAALHQMVREGRGAAWLSTDDFRLPAVRTYLKLGFEPLLVHENQRERWPAVFDRLGMGELSARFRAVLEGPVWAAPKYPADVCNYAERLRQRRRWHAVRPCGTLHQDEIVSRDDESLYRPSALGTAGADVAEVAAGEERPFEVWFRAGPTGLDAGAQVRFFAVGQRPLGTNPQAADPTAPGFVEIIAAPPGARIEPAGLGFRVCEDALREGDEVRLACGRRGGFRWTPLAGRKDIEVVVDVGAGEPKMRLPEPVVVRVRPCEARRLDLLLPMTAAPGEPVRATVSVRDEFDNRVPVSGAVEVEAGGRKATAHLCDGLGRVDLGPIGAAPVRAGAWLPGAGLAAAGQWCVPSDGLSLYVGDMHVHDSTCEGTGFTHEAYHWAIEDKRLDFISVAVQCHNYLDNDKWQTVKQMAQAFLDEGRFVSFPAMEWQHSAWGDKVIHFLGGDQPFLPIDEDRYAHPWELYEALRGTDAFIISHHPGYETGRWVPGTDYGVMQTDVDRCLELWSMHGSSEGYDPGDRPLRAPRREEGAMAALRAGLRVGLVAGSDTHTARPGGSALEPLGYWGGLCAVWAERLTRRSLFEAFMARRTYALTGARIALEFTVNGAPMGGEVPRADSYCVAARVWAPDEIVKVEFLRSCEPLHAESPGRDSAEVRFEDRSPAAGGPLFYHCRVTLRGGDLAVCTPVWVNR